MGFFFVFWVGGCYVLVLRFFAVLFLVCFLFFALNCCCCFIGFFYAVFFAVLFLLLCVFFVADALFWLALSLIYIIFDA